MVKPTRVTNSIRALRFAHGGMTRADLAKHLGVTRQTVIGSRGCSGVPLDDVFQHPDGEGEPS